MYCPENYAKFGTKIRCNLIVLLYLNDQNRTDKNVFVISGFFNLKPLCLFLSAVIYLQLGSSLSPSTMTGGTCHQLGAVAPWRKEYIFSFIRCVF